MSNSVENRRTDRGVAQTIVVVSGAPRSGTSLMMQMLAAGGLEPLADGVRQADEDNPRGYLEFEPVKRTRQDASWTDGAGGKAVKVIHALVAALPARHEYRLILMQRPMEEVLASQRAMLARAGRTGAQVPEEQLRKAFELQLAELERWLARQPNFRTLAVRYADCIADPAVVAAEVNAFLGGGLDEGAMAAAVDGNLYRQRSAAGGGTSTSLSPEAIAQLVRGHREFLAFLERRVESRAVAEDILQTAFVRGLERGAGVEDENVVAWFYRVLRNSVIDHYRRRSTSARAMEAWGREFSGTQEPDATLRQEICQCVSGLLETLKPEYRDALRVVDVEEGKLSDLAQQSGITAENAAVRVHRARKALRRQVEQACGTCAEHGCFDCHCDRREGEHC